MPRFTELAGLFPRTGRSWQPRSLDELLGDQVGAEQDQSDPRDALGTLTPPSGDPSSVDFKTSGTWYELFFQVS
jgi:hypothetical protein